MPNEGMREKMARAMCVAAGHDPDGPTCDVYIPGDPDAIYPWACYRRYVDAALDALMEPTPAMLTEGGINGEWSGRVQGCENEEAANVWKAMVRAARSGK